MQRTRVISSEAQDHVSVVGHSDRVLECGLAKVTMQQTAPIQVQGVLQVDLLDVGVRRPSHADHVESVAVQVERMAQVRLLDLVDEYDLYDGVQWDVHGVCAHAVLRAVRRTIVSVAELLRRNVLDLGQQRRRC